MRSYRELFRTPEFTPFFVTSAARMAAQTFSDLALATLVYQATGSPLLSAVSMFGSQLAQVLGATFLLSGADRLPPRSALISIDLAFAAGTVVLSLHGLPVGAIFGVLLIQGLIASLGGGVRGGLLNEILSKDGYLLGRSVSNMSSSLMQIVGFATGAALLAVLSPRACLLVSAALYVASALGSRLGLTARPPRSAGRPSAAATWRTNKALWSSRPRRLVYLGLWVPNGLIIGCESLYVSYTPHAAGTLFACSALGMLAGNLAVGRLVAPARRTRLATPLRLLLAMPYLFFALEPGLLWAALVACVASIGFSGSLVQLERLLSLTPDKLAGHTLGLHSAGMLTMQGVSAALAGAVAELTSPAMAMTILAVMSISVTLSLDAAGRRHNRHLNSVSAVDSGADGVLQKAEVSGDR